MNSMIFWGIVLMIFCYLFWGAIFFVKILAKVILEKPYKTLEKNINKYFRKTMKSDNILDFKRNIQYVKEFIDLLSELSRSKKGDEIKISNVKFKYYRKAYNYENRYRRLYYRILNFC